MSSHTPSQWHLLIPGKDIEHSGVIHNALQRYLQFDTFAGVIPATAIDLLFIPDDLKLLIEQAMSFYSSNKEALDKLSQNRREEAVRAHLCGFIKLLIINDDMWHDAFTKLHEKNRKIYDELSTPARVEMLLDRHENADTIATAVNKYQSEYVPSYTPAELVAWVIDAKRFHLENSQRLEPMTQKEQRDIISRFLAGKLDPTW